MRRPRPLDAPWTAQRLARWVAVAVLAVIAAVLERQGYGPGGNRAPDRPVPQNGEVTGTPNLVDGDSFKMAGYEVRMLGIDAPEGRQTCQRDGREWPCGEDSRRQLARLIGGRPVTCRSDEPDQHGRLLGTCAVNGQNLNREMVASGYAVAFGQRYAREEREARDAKRGLWSGTFQRPQEWRRERGIGGSR